MKVGCVLLSMDNYYLGNEGQLPERPSFDKEFLTNLCKDRTLLSSVNTLKDLPKSILDTCSSVTTSTASFWEVNIGIKTFRECPPDIFFITRSNEWLKDGKQFDIKWLENKYIMVLNHNNLEIWLKK